MANITQQNPIRYQIDSLSTRLYGVISTATNAEISFARATKVSKISVLGVQPSGTHRYIAFRRNGLWGKLTSAGRFSAFATNSVDYENMEQNANTPAELTALTNIPDLVGRSCGVAIALCADDPANALPTCGLSFTCITDTQQTQAVETSPVYDFGDGSQVITLEADTLASSGGNVSVEARVRRENGEFTEWRALNSCTGEKTTGIQFRGTYRASNVGVSSARINSVSCVYADGQSIVSGVASGEIITLTEDWYMPVKHCRLTIKHAPLSRSTMKTYIAFRKSPVHVEHENLGIGTGGRKTFALSNTEGLKYDSLKLYYDNVQTFTDYEFNCEAGRITCEAPEGVIVTCDYEYGWGLEKWEPMEMTSRLSMEEYDQSEYRFTGNEEGLSVCALKIELKMSSGHVTSERLGTSTGTVQSFMTERIIDDGKITLTADYALLPAKNWTLGDDPQIVIVSADAGKVIRASYDWVSEVPKVYEYYAVYSE